MARPSSKKPAPAKKPAKVSKAPKTQKKTLADYGIIEDSSEKLDAGLSTAPVQFPIDYSKLQGSLQNGRDNAVTAFAVAEGGGDSLVLKTTLNVNGSALPTLVPLKHGREFVRRLTDLLDRAEAEGLNVG